jgi:hypothetical protein
MRKASTVLLEQETQAPSPAPDLIPAANERRNLIGNSHSDWYSKRGHLTCSEQKQQRDVQNFKIQTHPSSSLAPRPVWEPLGSVELIPERSFKRELDSVRKHGVLNDKNALERLV